MKEMMAMLLSQALEVPLEVAVEDHQEVMPLSKFLLTIVFILVDECLLWL